jgi:uncharacterized oligopeptide transporter (OPT) family protein
MTDMTPTQLWSRYIRYIGAGAVAAAGIITLVRSLPVMVDSFRIGFSQLRSERGARPVAVPRTGLDLPLKFVGIGVLLVIAILAFVPIPFGDVGGFSHRWSLRCAWLCSRFSSLLSRPGSSAWSA